MEDRIAEATKENKGMSRDELARILGVEPKENGQISDVHLLNACQRIARNKRVEALPERDRLEVQRRAGAEVRRLLGNE